MPEGGQTNHQTCYQDVFCRCSDTNAILGFVAAFGRVAIEDLTVKGFGGFGAILYKTTGSWRGGEVSHCVGVSVLVERSELEIDSVSIRDGLAGRKIISEHNDYKTEMAKVEKLYKLML